MLVSVVKMPRFEMYWKNETQYESIVSTLPPKRYKKVREFLHVVDNTEKGKPENKGDECFKVKPLLEAVRANCNTTEPEAKHSVKEQIIPTKSKKSGDVRQYNPKKPHKWDLKNLVRAGQSGIIMTSFFMVVKAALVETLVVLILLH